MANIFTLAGEILIDNTKANKGIEDTTKKAEKSGSKVGSAFGSIAKGAVAVGTAVVGAATTLGGAAVKMAKDTAATADEIDKMSQKIGISRTAYQEWDYVLSQNGMDISKLQTGVKTLASQMDKAASGSGAAAEAFKTLGVSVTNSDGSLRSREEVFNETIAALQGVTNETERATLANKLFGKAGSEMAPLLNQSAESTEALKQKAHELGMVMSDETVDAGVKFTDTMDTMKRTMGGVMNSLGGALLPIVQKFADLIQEKMPQIQAFMQRLTPVITRLIDKILPPLFNLIETILPILFDLLEALLPVFEEIISSILPIIIDLIQQLLPFFVQLIQDILPIFVELIQGLLPIITEILNTILPIFIELLQAILPPLIQIVQAILPVFIELLNTILPPILEIVQAILPIFVELINALMPIIVQIVQTVLPIFVEILQAILPPILEIVNMVLPIFKELLDALMPIITTLVEAILPVFVSILEMVEPILTPILNVLKILLEPLIDLINLILPPISELLKGLLEKILPPLQKAFEVVADILSGVFGAAFEAVGEVLENVMDIFGGVIDFITGVFTGDWEKAWDGLVSIFKGIINIVPTILEGVINTIIALLNGIISGINKLTGLVNIPEIPSIPNVELPRLRIGIDYVPYDEYPALLHKGERVLTESENKEYSEQGAALSADRKANADGTTTVIINIGEKAIYIENLEGKSPEEIDKFVDELLEIVEEKIKRRGVVFA